MVKKAHVAQVYFSLFGRFYLTRFWRRRNMRLLNPSLFLPINAAIWKALWLRYLSGMAPNASAFGGAGGRNLLNCVGPRMILTS